MQPKPLIQNAPPELQTVRDLCQTCAHADSCALREDPSSPVHQCEEYDDGARAAAVPAPPLVSLPSAAETRETAAAPHLGLCTNCEHRETCTLPRPAGGVWHCEEYR